MVERVAERRVVKLRWFLVANIADIMMKDEI
jgi:hypothetical protein